MKIGIYSYTFHLSFGKHEYKPKNPINIFDFMDKVSSYGYEEIQIDPMHMESHEDEYLKKVVDHAKKLNLFIEFGACGIESSYMSNNIDMTVKLGSNILRTYIGFNRFDKNLYVKDEIEKAIIELNKVKDKAEKNDVRIAIENHGDVSSDELLYIMDKVNSPFVGICADIGNVMVCQEDPVRAMKKLIPKAITMHFKDYKTQMTNYGYKVYGVPLGEGNIDIDTSFEIIKYNPNLDRLIIETPSEMESTDELSMSKENRVAKISIDYARKKFGI